jgi:hypothetical protein
MLQQNSLVRQSHDSSAGHSTACPCRALGSIPSQSMWDVCEAKRQIRKMSPRTALFPWVSFHWGCKWWCSWMRHGTTSQKVTGSIPDGVITNLHWHNPSSCTMTLGSTQPLTEISTRKISWGWKAASTYSWQPYHLHVLTVWKSGTLGACPGIYRPCFTC